MIFLLLGHCPRGQYFIGVKIGNFKEKKRFCFFWFVCFLFLFFFVFCFVFCFCLFVCLFFNPVKFECNLLFKSLFRAQNLKKNRLKPSFKDYFTIDSTVF